MLKSILFIAPLTVSYATLIQWGTCRQDYGSPAAVDCGRLSVPLDYTEHGGEMLSLELLRVPAVKQPAKGSILLNFGGPGSPGRVPLAANAPILQMLSGYNYNLIAFDPRGTGDTIPFACYEAPLEKFLLASDVTRIARSRDKADLGRQWARGTITANKCAEMQNKTGRLISTAFVARDMVEVAEALGEDGMLRYWGFSYGTTLGATLVSMFPDKVDKVVLDGVQNPHEYYRSYADVEEWSDSDAEFSQIFEHCVQNPKECPLARSATAAELERSVWDLIERLEYRPVPLGGFVIDRATLVSLIVEALYSTLLWPRLVTALDMLINGPEDEAFLLSVFHLDSPDAALDSALESEQSLLGIHCLDRSARAGSQERLMPALEKIANVSRVFDGVTAGISMACAQWKLQPKERYDGNFQVKPKNPVLLIGNTWDGLTPVRSARNVSSGFDGSVVLEIHGHGHASLDLPSACSLKAQNAYWQDGTMPVPGTVCKVDGPPFSNVTWADVSHMGLEVVH